MISVASEIDRFIQNYMEKRKEWISKYSEKLYASMNYSLTNGGKRFRPALCLCVAQSLGVDRERAMPFAMALEMIHTYSLIHDDLPCMDNDIERRGQPTNHIVYGEPLALLAGDALLTEAFLVVAQSYGDVASGLVAVLARASGASGMVGGQAMDMGLGQPMDSDVSLMLCHKGKTAALIAAAAEGAGVLAQLNDEQQKALKEFGENLGLAFQIKDDVLDAESTPNSILHYWSVPQVEQYLRNLEERGRELLLKLPLEPQELLAYFKYNYGRTQ